MFPYKDDNPTLATPVVTILLIGVNVAVWILVQGMGNDPALSQSVCSLGLIPGELLGRVLPGTELPLSPGMTCVLGVERHVYTPLTSMFLHGGWLHLIGNMWFLWVFGNNVEDSMGRLRYLAFYLLCGLAAAATQTFVNPSSILPMVGASGAISGVMGAYVILYPRVRVHMIVFLFIFSSPGSRCPRTSCWGTGSCFSCWAAARGRARAVWRSGRTWAALWRGRRS
jgi:membrane associated rhomboid family serine protease